MSEWIAVEDKMPDKAEPIVYAKPDGRFSDRWRVGIAYWTVSNKWNPEPCSPIDLQGFTHWMPLPGRPLL